MIVICLIFFEKSYYYTAVPERCQYLFFGQSRNGWTPLLLYSHYSKIKMSNRTAGIIDSEIDAIKVNNPNWIADIGDKALITALTIEKNQLAQAQSGN
jgi:hypothetical protein